MKIKLSVWFSLCFAFLVCSSNAAMLITDSVGTKYFFASGPLDYGNQRVVLLQTLTPYDWRGDMGLLFFDLNSGNVKIISFFDYLRVIEAKYIPGASEFYGYAAGVGGTGATTLRISLGNYVQDPRAGSAPKDLAAASEPHRLNSPALIEAFQTLESAFRDITKSSAAAVLRGEISTTEGIPLIYLFYLYNVFQVTNDGVMGFRMIVELFYDGEQLGTTEGLLFFKDNGRGFYNMIFTWFQSDTLNSGSTGSNSFEAGGYNESLVVFYNNASLWMRFSWQQ